MLASMLELLDDCIVFDRSTGIKPFLLLDGHHSRMKLPFLKYINDDNHPWVVCVGVPYGTHIWQVADAPQLNGAFKIELTKAKREYIQHKDCDTKRFCPTDCVPLVNMAWINSFAQVAFAQKAIVQRGWNPMNYVLLDHPKLIQLDTNTTDNSTDDNAPVNESSLVVINVFDADTNATPTVTSSTTSTVLASINTDGPIVASYIDVLIEEKLKAIGRKRKYEEQKKQREVNKGKLNALTDITRVSSGQLAIHDHWILGLSLLDVVPKRADDDDQKRDESEIKRSTAKEKEQEVFSKTYQKYRNNLPLSVTDKRNLLWKVKVVGDLPLRTRAAEVSVQWETRKVCFDDYIVSTPSVSEPDIFSGRCTLTHDPVLEEMEELIFGENGSE